MAPSWKQLALIPESTTKAAILKALDVQPPPEGISDTFRDQGLYVLYSPPRDSFAYWVVSRAGDDGVMLSSMCHADGSEALRACHTVPGTPTGDALRQWMRAKGWRPQKERDEENGENRSTVQAPFDGLGPDREARSSQSSVMAAQADTRVII